MAGYSVMSMMLSNSLYGSVPYSPPQWMLSSPLIACPAVPSHRIQLGRLPTPIHAFQQALDDTSSTSVKVNLFIKRDDLTSFDLSGNKVRKLEFLLSEALQQKCDCVITIGGIQSNHARSTAVAARQLGLDPFLILRTRGDPSQDPGLAGNLLLDRLVGAKIYQVSAGTYAQLGQRQLLETLRQQLVKEGRRPYVIPVGGSSTLGAWGYLDAIEEMGEQVDALKLPPFDHLVFACGSGGTASGLAIGSRLSGMKWRVHAVGVCDSPDYFYAHILETAEALGVDLQAAGHPRSWCTIHDGKGKGYAVSTPEELAFIASVSWRTGILLDPVYSGKALFTLQRLLQDPEAAARAGFKTGVNVLFLHTGGVFGLFDKASELQEIITGSNGFASLPFLPVEKLNITSPRHL